MSIDDSLARFLALAQFFLKDKEALLEEPYRGNVGVIWALFANFCKEHGFSLIVVTGAASFVLLLEEFNDVSGTALILKTNKSPEQTKIEWINVANIEILKNRLTSDSAFEESQVAVDCSSQSEVKPVFQSLFQILDGPLRTEIESSRKINGFDYDYSRLWDALTEPTAMVQLGKARAELTSTKKPYFEVCENKHHIHVITNTFFNSKTLGLSNEIPSNARVTKLLAAAQHMIDKEVLECIRTKIHFLPLITNYTDVNLGNCSYLDTCHKLKNCRYVHYFTMCPPLQPNTKETEKQVVAMEYTIGECHDSSTRKPLPPQWINCDVRNLPFSILGKFAAIISDPAWDIHMALPYGTCKDTELLSLPMQELQDEGIICLWVTGRSIEIGRKALGQWGYTVSDEVIWIKTNQLNRTIVTGRTGHWLNHSKEHLLVGVKGNPIWLNRKIDVDFIVSGTRETLRKPDELYEIVERIVGKHARKLEIFGRDNNIRPGWVSMYETDRFCSFHLLQTIY